MKKVICLGFVIVVGLGLQTPLAAGMLGISTYAARRLVDAIFTGLSFWTIVSLFAVSGGGLAFAIGMLKFMWRRVGKRLAISW